MNTRSNSSKTITARAAKTDPRTTKKPQNRIWVEFELTRDEAHAEEVCKLANNMLARLMGVPVADLQATFFRMPEARTAWCFGGDMGYVSLPDRGHWLNLDHLGRPLEETISNAQERLDTLAAERNLLASALQRLVLVCEGAGWNRHKTDALAQAYKALNRPDPQYTSSRPVYEKRK